MPIPKPDVSERSVLTSAGIITWCDHRLMMIDAHADWDDPDETLTAIALKEELEAIKELIG